MIGLVLLVLILAALALGIWGIVLLAHRRYVGGGISVGVGFAGVVVLGVVFGMVMVFG